MDDIRLNDIVYLKSGSLKLIVIGLLDEIVKVKIFPDGDEACLNVACLSYNNCSKWLEQYPEYIVH